MAQQWQTPAYTELNRSLIAALGDKTAKAFAALGILTVGDLLRHLPRRYFLGTELSDLSTLQPGQEAAVVAQVRSVGTTGQGSKARVEAVITDGNGTLRLTFFGRETYLKWWAKQLGLGVKGIFVGKVGEFNGQLQLTHPTFVMLDENGNVVGKADKQDLVTTVSRSGLVGLYPASSKLPTWTIAACANLILDQLGEIPDPIPIEVRRRAEVMPLAAALLEIHRPAQIDDVEKARHRLIFDEAFATQLMMAKRRKQAVADPAVPRLRRDDGILAAFDAALPFTLTSGQQQVGAEIFADLASEHPMQRLLQGEVGSGKTIVALRAMLAVVDAGGQAALLAPTEVLAAQHAATLNSMLGELAQGGTLAAAEHATTVTLLTGSTPAAARRQVLSAIANNTAGIIVGTHALLSDQVKFADLGLVVVDEQHRFGVEQRAALQAKSTNRPHVLVMTATPIPRSVAMTIFGDLAVSSLTEIPAGRSTVSTTVVDEVAHPTWVARAWQRIVEEVTQGRQAFIVAPRIGDKTGLDDVSSDGASVVDLYDQLTSGALAGVRTAMVHGQLSAQEKENVMAKFAAAEIDVLIATTVIEVGIDVPNASMMVICDADRFGISQLHQLRGRIGRGKHPGVCLLLTKAEPLSTARERLDAVASTTDGFELAEVDLAQRREGNVLGTKQAGTRSSLRLLRVTEHAEIIMHARHIAEDCIEHDPDLVDPGLADAVRFCELLAENVEN